MKEFGGFFQLEVTFGQPLLFKYICAEFWDRVSSSCVSVKVRFPDSLLYETCGYERLCLLGKTSQVALIVRHLSTLDN